MTPDRARPVLVAAIAVLAIAIAAATLNSAVVVEEGVGTGGGGEFGAGDGTGGGGTITPPALPFSGGFPSIPLPCFPVLNEPWFVIAVLAIVAAVCYALYREAGPLGPVGFLLAIGPPGVLLHSLLTACRTATLNVMESAGNATNVSIPLQAASGGGGAGAPSPSLILLAVLGVAVVVSAALLMRSTGDDEARRREEVPPEASDQERRAAVGRAAGRAADRIEGDATAENAVYRAWRDMTAHLDVDNPESSTPSEFAAAAASAGMDPDDVAELTAVFEEVRYGEAEPTPDREERALAALRRIEEAYAEDA